MSTVWGTRHRLLLEKLGHLADRLAAQPPPEPIAPEPIAPEPIAPEPIAVEEPAVRLLLGAVRLLREHQVDHRGQCRFCWTWQWRVWRRRPRCTVHRALDFAMAQPLDVVWWQLFTATGAEVVFDDVRAWLRQRDQPGAPPDRRARREPGR